MDGLSGKVRMTEKTADDIAGEAYQVIGSIAAAAGLFNHPKVQRALTYFSTDYMLGSDAAPARQILPFLMGMPPQTARDGRQQQVFDWAKRCFGEDHATSIPQRGIRFGEEACELTQAAGVDRDMMHKLVDFVYDRPVGEIAQEFGGVGVTLLSLARAAGLSADAEEAREVERILSKTPSHFLERNKAKDAAGFNVTGAYPTPPE